MKYVIRILIAALLAFGITGMSAANPTLAATVTGCPTTETALQTDIRNAGAGGTVTFNCSTATTIPFTSTINITNAVTLDGSTSQEHISFNGGGHSEMFSVYSGSIFGLTGLTLSGGYTTGSGGAIGNYGYLTITGSTLSGNSTSSNFGTDRGGAIYNGTIGTVTVTNSTFSGNSSAEGGAIYNDGNTMTITNSTFSGNSAGAGGAIYNHNTMTITNSTLSTDSAVHTGAIVNDGGTLMIGGSILGDNCTSYYIDPTDLGYNLNPNGTCVKGGTGDIQSGTVIDQIPTSYTIPDTTTPLCPPTDQRGFPRPDNSEPTCDIGAYEYQDAGGVTQQGQNITFGALSNTTYGAAAFTVSATASSGLPVSFSSATSLVCTVSGTNGSTVTIVTAGTCTISANQAGNSTYTAAPGGQQSFTVAKATPVISWSNPTGITYGTALSSTQLDATANVLGSFSYTPAAGTVLNAGSGQTLSVKFTPTDTTDYSATSASVTIDVAKASQTISFTSSAPTSAVVGDRYTPAATATSGNPVTLGASGVCSYNAGTVTMTTAGTCTVTGDQSGGTNYNAAAPVSQSFTVTAPQQSTTLSVATASGSYGGSADLSATLMTGTTPVSGETIVFSLNGTVVCGSPTSVTCPTTADGTNGTTAGVATLTGVSLSGISAGTYPGDVSASFAGNSGYTASTGSNSLTVITANQTITVTTKAPTSQVYQGTFTVAATSNSSLTVSYGSTGGCTNSGATYTMTSGTTACTVTFDQSGTGNYTAATQVTETVTATKATATLALSNLSQTYDGTAKYATASTTPGGLAGSTISYTQNGSVVNAPTNAGSYSVDASLTNANYTASDATGTLVIAKSDQTVSFNLPAGFSKTYGNTSFDISSYASARSLLPVSFSSATTSVCSASGTNGSTVTILTAGTCTINADQAGNANYNKATTVQQSFTVKQAVPTITWTTPLAISYGTALSSTQLDATASVPGTFTYSRAAGTVLNAGSQTLSVTFTPTDTTDYTNATTTVSITVSPLSTTTQYTGTQLWILGGTGQTWSLAATVTPSICTSSGNGSVVYTLDPNPLIGSAGPYTLASASPPTSTWQEGVYTLTATYTSSTGNCTTSSDTATLTIGGAGDSANGGGWTTVQGHGRLNFGFTVQSVPKTSPTQYKGQFVMVNPGAWRVKGTLSSYTKTTTTNGAASGTATVERWNATTLTWDQVQTGVSFTISVTSGSGGKKGTPATFGEHFSIAGPPSFAPLALKGGNITVR